MRWQMRISEMPVGLCVPFVRNPAPSLVPRFGDENENQQQGELASGEPPSHANAPPKNKVSQTISRLLANSNFNVGKRRGRTMNRDPP